MTKINRVLKDIVYKTKPTDPEAPSFGQTDMRNETIAGDGISLLNGLLSSINSKSVPRRALFSNVPMELGPGLRISVTGYLIFKRQEPARSCYIWLGEEKPQLVKGATTLIADDNARVVEKWEIRKAYKFGGEQVSFTPDEQQSLRSFGDPVIRILGFKPMSALPFWASVKHPTFIYPSEEDYIGSTRVFSALYQKLLGDGKIAIVWFIPRRNASPVLAAMLPGAEKLDEEDIQKIPPGMWILPLPFADDIRQNPETNLVSTSNELTDRMRDVIQQLQLPKAQYDPQKYPNPSLQWHYRILQALALDEDLPEQPDDKTIPRYRQIDKRVGEYVISWGEELEREYNQIFSGKAHTSTLGKRPAAHAGGQPVSKKPVKDKLDPKAAIDGVENAFKNGTLSKLTLLPLKEYLAAKNMSTTGKKADLVERIEVFLENK
jgi:ATP-dependent DNA helicase 2 subunit 1